MRIERVLCFVAIFGSSVFIRIIAIARRFEAWPIGEILDDANPRRTGKKLTLTTHARHAHPVFHPKPNKGENKKCEVQAKSNDQ